MQAKEQPHFQWLLATYARNTDHPFPYHPCVYMHPPIDTHTHTQWYSVGST